jgi:hypothetical protein
MVCPFGVVEVHDGDDEDDVGPHAPASRDTGPYFAGRTVVRGSAI